MTKLLGEIAMLNDDVVEELKRAPCCGRMGSPIYLSGLKDLLTRSSPGGTFELRHCDACGVLYVNPRPVAAKLKLYYPEGDYLPIKDLNTPWRRSHTTLKAVLGSIASLPYTLRFGSPSEQLKIAPGTLLDVGCGRGEFMKVMASRGWKVFGCDIASDKISYVGATYGAEKVRCGTFEDVDFAASFFDAITMWHVIEHFQDPFGALRKAHGLLKPGGTLVVGTPNWDCAEARLFGRFWIGFDAPRHLLIFSTDGLRRALEQTGFQLISVRPSLWANTVPESIVFALQNLLNVKLWNSRLHLVMYYLLFALVASSRSLGNWSIIEVTARKS